MSEYITVKHSEEVISADANEPGTVCLYASEDGQNFHWLSVEAARKLAHQLIIAAAETEAAKIAEEAEKRQTVDAVLQEVLA